MQKITFLVLFSVFSFNLAAQEFWVKEFYKDDNDITARVSAKKDRNGKDAAMIKIYTDLTGLSFDCIQGFAADVDYRTGEYRMYVSEGERMIKIRKEGFMPLDYVIELPLAALTTYRMMLTRKGFAPQDETTKLDFVKIYSSPDAADVFLNGELKGTTPFEQMVPEGAYAYRIDKKMYYYDEGMINVLQGRTPEVNVSLRPKFGNFKVSSVPGEADIYLNNEPTGKKTPAEFEFQNPGTYTVTLKKYLYLDKTHTFTLAEGKTENVTLNLQADFAGITITGTPETGANITLDNKDLNQTTPYTLPQLSSGTHTVRLTKTMYKPAELTFTVTPGKSETVTVSMIPTFADITVTAAPDAEIYIDGTRKGTGKVTERLNEGSHLIELKKDKYIEQKQSVTVTAGKPETFAYTLLPRKGSIAVTSKPTKAEVYLNGTLKGTSPVVIPDVLIGSYTVETRFAGYAAATQSVTVTEGQTAQADLTLASGLSVTINSDPAGADIYVNGTQKGKAPQTLSLTFGDHKIKLAGVAKYKDTEHTITVKQGGQTSYTLALQSEITDNMVLIKGGTFQMGSNDGESDEKPVRSVTVSDFYMGKYEVTQKEWRDIMGTNPSATDRGIGDNYPVNQVSWDDIQTYLQKLNAKTGQRYRLPTEAEWEYAAGGGASRRTKWAGTDSESALGSYAWYDANAGNKTHPVGQKSPNKLGLYDMTGNVWEWCSDWDGAYPAGSQTNPQGATKGTGRVNRGGGWSYSPLYCRVANRSNYYPAYRSDGLGFCLVRSL